MPATPSFVFSSGDRELIATGIHQRIDTPASDGFDADGRFQQALSSAFEQAAEAGLDDPLIVGALPFDSTQPACLFVPTSHEWRPKTSSPVLFSNGAPALVHAEDTPDESGFKHAVRHAIVNFQYSEVRKAVLSVMKELHFAAPIDLDKLQASLRAQNPTGYQFRVSLPNGDTLLGVSPELLLSRHGHTVVSHPLAGSIPRHPQPMDDQQNAQRLLASEKDHYEHKLVVDNIRQHLEPLCSALDVPARPSLVQTAALWHLGSRLQGTLQDTRLNALQLACLLHPTPAVCGVPTERARRLIRFVEPFDRGLFTGMVGWCNRHGDGEWIVTIRCGIARNTSIRLFAGAGIVEASSPASEWNEVQTKLKTMLRACGLS